MPAGTLKRGDKINHNRMVLLFKNLGTSGT